jgi:hypothetical protein
MPDPDAYCPAHDLFGCPVCHGAPPRTEFRSQTEKEIYYAHLAPDDPVRRCVGAFGFEPVPDPEEVGY